MTVYRERQRCFTERERERETETDRQTDRQRQRERRRVMFKEMLNKITLSERDKGWAGVRVGAGGVML